MPYLWQTPENAREREYSEYEYDSSPDREALSEGQPFDLARGTPRFRFLGSAKVLERLDAFPNTAHVPLVNERLALILRERAADDIQLVPAELLLGGKPAPGQYFVVNALRRVRGIDWDYSVGWKLKGIDSYIGFHQLRFRPDCLGSAQLAREEEYEEHLLVSPLLVEVLRAAKVRGVAFKRADEVKR